MAMGKYASSIRTQGDQRCGNCRYWKTVPIPEADAGHCHRFAPHGEGWPVTGKDEWCGEHQASRCYFSEATLSFLKLAVGLALLTFMIVVTIERLQF